VLRKRTIRELAALIALVLVVAVSMLPAMYQARAEEQGQEWFGELVPTSVTSSISRIAAVFPPSIAAQGLEAIVFDGPGFSSSLIWLIVWTLAGATIGFAIVRRNLLEGERATHSGSKRGVETNIMPRWSIDRLTMLPLDVRAVAAKELLYLVRSTVGKFNIVITPILVIVMALLVARDVEHAILGLDRTSLVFVGLMIYASMLSVNFLFNAFAWEGAGVQSFFLCPVPPERVVLGKNLGTWLYSLAIGIESLVIFVLLSGLPPVSALIGGFLAFVAAVLSVTLVGNFLSPIMPVPRDISSITNSPSQTAVLATFGVLIANVLVIGAMMTLPAVMGVSWLGPLLLLVLIAVETAVYAAMLRPAGRLLDRRRESLIEALQV
jgi:hypothetical protein